MKTIFQAKMLHWDILLEMILLFGLHQVPKLMKLKLKPNPDVNPNIGEIGNTNSINGIPTKQLNNLYNSSGRDSECLRFFHCIYYTSAARGFIRVLFKIPLNTFIIVRFRLWHLLMKS